MLPQQVDTTPFKVGYEDTTAIQANDWPVARQRDGGQNLPGSALLKIGAEWMLRSESGGR